MYVFNNLLLFLGILVILVSLCVFWPLLGRTLATLTGCIPRNPSLMKTLAGKILFKSIRWLTHLWGTVPAPKMARWVVGLSLGAFVWLVGTHLAHPACTVGVGGGLALLMCIQVGFCSLLTLSMVFLACVPGVWQCRHLVPWAVFAGAAAVVVFAVSNGLLLYYVIVFCSMGWCESAALAVAQCMGVCLSLGLLRLGVAPRRDAPGGVWGEGCTVRLLHAAKRLFVLLALLQGLCVVVGFGCMFGFVGWLELAVHLYSVWTPFVVDPMAIDTLMYHHIVHAYGVGSSVLWDAAYYQTLVGGGSFFI